ncbi:MAG: hypothetical protein AB7V74_26695 [Acidimicrobiia bacterium]
MSEGGGNGKVWHLISDHDNEGVTFPVSPATLEVARTAPYPYEEPAIFGELRCTDDLDELERQLGRAGVDDLESHIAAIERSAARAPAPGDLAAHLRALRHVDVHWESVETDDSEYELLGEMDGLDFDGGDMWAEPYWRVVYDAMRDEYDIPDDLKKLHVNDFEDGSPVWWGRLYTSVIPRHSTSWSPNSEPAGSPSLANPGKRLTEYEDPEEHPDFERLGEVYTTAIDPDWVDVDDNDFWLFHVGRIGNVYFEIDVERNSPWTELGSWPSLDAFMKDYPEPGRELCI